MVDSQLLGVIRDERINIDAVNKLINNQRTMKLCVFLILLLLLFTNCANYKEREVISAHNAQNELSGTFILDSNMNNSSLPLNRFGFESNQESFEVLFTKNGELVIRTTNLQKGNIKYFPGEFKKNGVYEYVEKKFQSIHFSN